MAWWLWVVVGIALLAAEVLSPGGFVLLFFGVAALLVGFAAGAGAIDSLIVELLLFSALSIGSLLLFRRRLVDRFNTPSSRRGDIDTLSNEIAIAVEDLAPGAVGKAELRGTSWSVRNVGEQPLRAGERCRVVGKEGLTLFLRAD